MLIPFNKKHVSANEKKYIFSMIEDIPGKGSVDFEFECKKILRGLTKSKSVHVTNSCTSALEMAAILCNIKFGDEVIMPSFTFTSTANAVILRGGVPVFVDINDTDLNIDVSKIEAAITPKTKAIFVIHYAGVLCDLRNVRDIARRFNLLMVEDAAQAIGATRDGISPGELSDYAAFSFHETKNITCGEGGCLTTNVAEANIRAEIIREKGTNRNAFLRGEADKYTWRDIGSSYVPSALTVSVLSAQLEEVKKVNEKKLKIWDYYFEGLSELENKGFLRRPIIDKECAHNAHIFFILLENKKSRKNFIEFMKDKGISVLTHYEPLHLTEFSKKNCIVSGKLSVTESISERLIRLPIYPAMLNEHEIVLENVKGFFTS
ncbi:dTDP-4-amino-4,6-dideoxygalactose transaminase [Alphaproteobacteria bacterium]|nr:dTDP-4-amino-4,6-dideoxygalactose transaminase [Alphaproteobacteria bacterium]